MQGFLDQYGLMVGLIGLGVAAVAVALVVFLFFKLNKLNKRLASMFAGTDGKSVEAALRDQLGGHIQINARLDQAESRLGGLETKMESAKRFVGVVRYDAFEDVGGSQSFALAVYDEKGDGAVVTSMVGRADCRVYAKEIKQGKSERELSKEEQSAIEAAVKTRTGPTEARAGR